MRTAAQNLLFGIALIVGMSLPMAADTIPSHQITPDRGGRSHRELPPDSQQFVNDESNVIQDSVGDLSRPGRNSFANIDDDVDLPSNDGDVKTASNPAAPDVPTEPVPEPATLLL